MIATASERIGAAVAGSLGEPLVGALLDLLAALDDLRWRLVDALRRGLGSPS